MRRIFRKTIIGVALLAPLTLVGGLGTASATSGNVVAAVVGTGTINPGLPLTGCQGGQHVDFTGTVTVAAGAHTGTYTIAFSGDSDICETLNAGHGFGTLDGHGGTVGGSVEYTRTGNAVDVKGNAVLNGHSHKILQAECVFAPVPGNPITTYGLTCTAVLDV